MNTEYVKFTFTIIFDNHYEKTALRLRLCNLYNIKNEAHIKV
jgi:hypothetical protein